MYIYDESTPSCGWRLNSVFFTAALSLQGMKLKTREACLPRGIDQAPAARSGWEILRQCEAMQKLKACDVVWKRKK